MILQCKRCRTTRATERDFNTMSIQQPGTYLQDAHSAPSIRDRSRSATKKQVLFSDKSLDLQSRHKNKVHSIRPTAEEDTCDFSLQVVCSKIDNNWYL